MFVTQALTPAQITAATGQPAIQPIRVYAGVHDTETIEQTADRSSPSCTAPALSTARSSRGHGDGQRLGQRLVLAVDRVPHRRGQRDRVDAVLLPAERPRAADRPGDAEEAGRALFDKVYAELSKLPRSPAEARRRRESLGAYGGLSAFSDVDDMLPGHRAVCGAARRAFRNRGAPLRLPDPGFPQISPVIDNGRHIRFATNDVELTTDYVGRPLGRWEEPRFVFLQHPSDPVVCGPVTPRRRTRPAARAARPRCQSRRHMDPLRHVLAAHHGHGGRTQPALRLWPPLRPRDGAGVGAVLGDEAGRDYSRILAAIERTASRLE